VVLSWLTDVPVVKLAGALGADRSQCCPREQPSGPAAADLASNAQDGHAHFSQNLSCSRPVAGSVDLAGQDPWLPAVTPALQPEAYHGPELFQPGILRLM
jgi:hypothetical protein